MRTAKHILHFGWAISGDWCWIAERISRILLWNMAIPYVVVLCLAFMRKSYEPKVMGLAQRSYSLMLFGVVFLLIELLLLLDHTYSGSQIILGVQGRYFIPALPLLFLFLRNNTIELKQNFDTKLLYLLSVLNSGIFIYSCSKIV